MEVDDPSMIHISKLEVDILEEEMTNQQAEIFDLKQREERYGIELDQQIDEIL